MSRLDKVIAISLITLLAGLDVVLLVLNIAGVL